MFEGLALRAALSRVPWRLIGIALLVAAILVQTIRLDHSQRRADALQFRLNEARAALDEQSRKSRERQSEVGKRDRKSTRLNSSH